MSNTSNDNKPHAVLTVSELAKRWRCTRASIMAAIHAGSLRAFRIGARTHRVAMDEVERYEKQEMRVA